MTEPPVFFGGTRFLVAGLLLLLLAIFRGETRRLSRQDLGRLLLVQLLIATFLSGVTMLPGGLILTFGAWTFEPGARAAAWFNWSAAAWAGWIFLVVFGSLVAFTTYLRLIAAWGPAHAGSYAYVSPVIAVLLGGVLLHERVGVRDVAGMVLLLVAAFCSLRASISTPAKSCTHFSH